MAQSINLIPRQEIAIQKETKLLGVSTIVSFVVLGLTSIIAIYFVIVSTSLKRNVKVLDANIESLRNDIRSMSNIEIVARNMDKKYAVLKTIFDNRYYYSKLLTELYARKPEGVYLADFNLKPGIGVDVSGRADTYLSVADFTNALVDKSFAGGDPLLKDLFTEVSLNSVNLESSDGGATFSISVKFNPDKLKEVL